MPKSVFLEIFAYFALFFAFWNVLAGILLLLRWPGGLFCRFKR